MPPAPASSFSTAVGGPRQQASIRRRRKPTGAPRSITMTRVASSAGASARPSSRRRLDHRQHHAAQIGKSQQALAARAAYAQARQPQDFADIRRARNPKRRSAKRNTTMCTIARRHPEPTRRPRGSQASGSTVRDSWRLAFSHCGAGFLRPARRSPRSPPQGPRRRAPAAWRPPPLRAAALPASSATAATCCAPRAASFIEPENGFGAGSESAGCWRQPPPCPSRP